MKLQDKRIQALYSYNILDSEAEEAFDNLARLAAQICKTSVAQINFLDRDRQWAKATLGWGMQEMPREIGFCTHTIEMDNSLMIVEDTHSDDRFKDNPLVHKNPPLRSYAGTSIKSENGHAIGALCVYDSEPKKYSDEQIESLQILAREIETHLKLRHNNEQIKDAFENEARLNKKIIEGLPASFFMYDEQGKIIRWNDKFLEASGYSEKEVIDMKPTDFFHPDDHSLITEKIQRVFKEGQASLESDIINKNNLRIPYLLTASRFEVDNKKYFIGAGQDISALKETQQKLAHSLNEKSVLLSEIHHRVKNNLAIISGILQLEAFEIKDSMAQDVLMSTIFRIRSIANIHELMYEQKDLSRVAFHKVIKAIKNDYTHSDNVNIRCDVENLILNVNQAVPCGLVINELLSIICNGSNSSNQDQAIDLEMKISDGNILIRIFGPELKYCESEEKYEIEFTFINRFIKQLDGKLTINREGGSEYLIEFEKKEVKGTSSSLDFN